MSRVARAGASLLVLVVALVRCAPDGDEAWRHADELWRHRDPGAFAAWHKLDRSTPQGMSAQQRLVKADAAYRRGIALVADGDERARDVLAGAAATAPLDPALYLPLARACHARGLDDRAAALYRKFLAQAPPGKGDGAAARRELAALGDDLTALFDPPRAAGSRWPAWLPLALGFVVVAIVVLALALTRRRRRPSLASLAAESPELQPAIAFLVGCLRHELFKHRILAVADAVRAMAAGQLGEVERRFLLQRLYGGEPLPLAWAGHLGAFMRALGPRFDLSRHDPGFRDADRAIALIAGAEASLSRGEPEAARALLDAHQRLAQFDAGLAQLTARLQHTIVDGEFLALVVGEVQRELGHAEVAITVTPPPQPLAVESYRQDLALVLRNVLRNAVVAAAAGPRPARVALDVDVALEPTGDEIVHLCVRDTNPAPVPSPAPLSEARGLALVRAALQRCDGSLAVAPGGDGFAKCVVVRLFRALAVTAEAA
jgi:signal transduction histidine kinase